MLAFIFFAILQLVLALPAPLSQRDLAATGPRAPIGAPLSSSTIPVVVRSRSEEDVLLPREEASLYTTIPLEKRSTLETIESRDYCTGEACESPAWTAGQITGTVIGAIAALVILGLIIKCFCCM